MASRQEEKEVGDLTGLSRVELIELIIELQKENFTLQHHLQKSNVLLKQQADDFDKERREWKETLKINDSIIENLNLKLSFEEDRSKKFEKKLKLTSISMDNLVNNAEELPLSPRDGSEEGLSAQKKALSRPRWSENVRTIRKLYLKISEAKDLPKGQNVLKTGLINEKWEALSTYVVISIGEKELGRTETLSKNLLWNQEFSFGIDTSFESINFTVWSKAKVKAVFRDGALAQLRLKKDLLSKDQSKHEDWFPLYVAKKQKETFLGAVQMDICLTSKQTEGLVTLVVKVISARNLGEKEELDHLYPYIALHLIPDLDLKTTKQTQMHPETFNPLFNETFTFSLERHQIMDTKLHVSVWNSNVLKTEKVSEHEFMGQTLIPLSEIPIITLSSGTEALPNNSHWYGLSGNSIANSMPTSGNILQASANRVLKKSNSVILNLGKLTKTQYNLASLVRALSTLDGTEAVAHDYIPFKQNENPDIVDCDQCGGDLMSNPKKPPHKCKICGLVVHDSCRVFVVAECATAGSLRLSYRYYQELLLPYGAYNDLLQIITEEPLLILTITASVCEIDRLQDLAQTSLNIFHSQGIAIKYLNQLVSVEVNSTKEPNTIFRGNSLATKSLDYFMKLIGTQYLHSVLKKPIDEIFSEKKNCELDPSRADLSKKSSIDWTQNRKNLQGYLKRILDSVFNSLEECPPPLREVFGHMQSEVAQKFAQEENIRYIVVSGFIFLRFFCPAILGPKLFGIRDDVPDPTVSRTLTLIAKVLQNLANVVDFGQKEPYMIDLNPFIYDNKEKMKVFIDALSNNRSSTVSRITELEDRVVQEEKVLDGIENINKATKNDKKQNVMVQRHLGDIKGKIDAIKSEIDRLKKIAENLSADTAPREFDYSGKFNFDVEAEMGRLHSLLAAKREQTLCVLESSGNPVYIITARKFGVVLDELDQLLERLQK